MSESECGVGLSLESGVRHVSISTFRTKADSLGSVHASSRTHEAGCKLGYERIEISSFAYSLRRSFVQSLRFVQVLPSEKKMRKEEVT